MKISIAARRNPELNKKVSITEALRKYKDDSRYYVTFTNTNLLKVNPKGSYKNPAGIYCYNIKDSWKIYDIENKGIDSLYAGSRKYAIIFAPKAGTSILNLDDFNKRDYQFYSKKLKKKIKSTFARKVLPKKEPEETWASYFLYTVESYIVDFSDYLGSRLSGTSQINKDKKIKWSSIFIDIGIHGIKDTTGSIRSGIPAMAVFFRKAFVEHVETIQIQFFDENDDKTNELFYERKQHI